MSLQDDLKAAYEAEDFDGAEAILARIESAQPMEERIKSEYASGNMDGALKLLDEYKAHNKILNDYAQLSPQELRTQKFNQEYGQSTPFEQTPTFKYLSQEARDIEEEGKYYTKLSPGDKLLYKDTKALPGMPFTPLDFVQTTSTPGAQIADSKVLSALSAANITDKIPLFRNNTWPLKTGPGDNWYDYIPRPAPIGGGGTKITDYIPGMGADFGNNLRRNSRAMLAAGHTSDMLSTNIRDIADVGASVAAHSWADKGLFPQTLNAYAAKKDYAIANSGDDRQEFKDSASARDILAKVQGMSGLAGDMVPYGVGGALMGPVTSAIGDATVGSLARFVTKGVDASKNEASSLTLRALHALGKGAQADAEIGIPHAIEKGFRLNRIKKYTDNPYLKMAPGQITSGTIQGGLEGWSRPDQSAEEGAMYGLSGGVLAHAFGPKLAHLDVEGRVPLNKNYRDALDYFRKNGYQGSTGMRYNDHDLQAGYHYAGANSGTARYVNTEKMVDQKMINKTMARDVLGLDQKEFADFYKSQHGKDFNFNDFEEFTPDVVDASKKFLGSKFDKIQNETTGRFTPKAIEEMKALVAKLGTSNDATDKQLYDLANNHLQTVLGYTKHTPQFVPKVMNSTELKSLGDELKNLRLTAPAGYEAKYRAEILPFYKTLKYANQKAGGKGANITDEEIKYLIRHEAGLLAKDGLNKDTALQPVYNGLKKHLERLKTQVAETRDPITGKFIPVEVPGSVMSQLSKKINIQLTNMYNSGEVLGLNSAHADQFKPFSKFVSDAYDEGYKLNSSMSEKKIRGERSKYAMAKTLDKGMTLGGDIDLHWIKDAFRADDRLMNDALRGRGISIDDFKGNDVNPKVALNHAANLGELLTQQHGALNTQGLNSEVARQSLLSRIFATPDSLIGSPIQKLAAKGHVKGGWPIETGWLGVRYKGKDSRGIKHSGIASPYNLLHARQGAVGANPHLLSALGINEDYYDSANNFISKLLGNTE